MKNVSPNGHCDAFGLSEKKTIAVLFLFFLFLLSFTNACTAQNSFELDWPLTSNATPVSSDLLTPNNMNLGSSLNSATYNATNGLSSGGWSNDAGSLRNNEYYEFSVTNSGNCVRAQVKGVSFEHSRSNGNWVTAVFYSFNNFTDAFQLGSNGAIGSGTPTLVSYNSDLTIPQNGTLSFRVYAWESDGPNRSYRLRNFAMTGIFIENSGIVPVASSSSVCVNDNVVLSGPLVASGTGISTVNASQSFDAAGWSYTTSGSGGTAGTSGSNVGGTGSPSNAGYGQSGNGYRVSNSRRVLRFGNQTGLTHLRSKYIGFSLASLSLNSTTNGAEFSDSVTVAISTDGGVTFNEVIQVTGNSNSRWSYSSGTARAEVILDGDNSPSVFTPSSSDLATIDGYSSVRIQLPDNVDQVQLKIILLNNNSNEVWAVDNVSLFGTTPSYTWTSLPVGLNSSLQSVTVSPNFTTTYQLNSNIDGCASLQSVIVNVSSPVTPSISITSNDADNSICSGSLVMFSSSITTGGPSPTYQWRLNGSPIFGANASSFTTSILNNGEVISCQLTSNAGCISSANVTSNSINTIVTNAVTPSVTVTSNDADNSICAGTSVTFTATPTNGGTTPAYQWKLNGANVGTNATTYSTTTLANNDVVTVVLTANNTCQTSATANGNSITTTVTNNVTPSVTIAVNTTNICPGGGTIVTFTAAPTNGGTAPAYQWKVNGSNVGTNSNIFSSSTLSGGDNVKVDMLANNQCQTVGMASSSSIAITALTVYNYYLDNDGDGYGNPSTGISDCTNPMGYVTDNSDCLDSNGDVYPDGAEICNGIDDNCDGVNDEGVELTTYYLDNDGDGFGGTSGSIQSCEIPSGYIQIGGDCNDNNVNVRPTAQELCSTNFDDDCDGLINEICFPGNDNPTFASNCPLSTSATLCTTITGNLQAATATETFGTGSLSSNPDVWYYFTANAVGMTIRCTPSVNDIGLELRTSSGELLKTMNALSAIGDEYMNYDDLSVGNQYYLRVMNMNGAVQGGNFTLCAKRIVPNSNAFNYTNVYVYNTGCTNVVPTNLSTFTSSTIVLTPVGGGLEYSAPGPVATLGEFLSSTGFGINYNTVYTGKVVKSAPYPLGNGTTELLTFTTNMTNTLNVLPVVDLDLSSNYTCPRTWSVGTMIRADRWICGAVKYQWRFEQYVNGQPYLVNGNPVVIEQYGPNGSRDIYTLAAYGFIPGSEWRVKIRPVFPNNVHGDYGTDEQCLKFKGSFAAAPTVEQEGDIWEMESRIQLYPNPSNSGDINIFSEQWMDTDMTMIIMDASGKKVFQQDYSETATIQESLNHLSNGMYLIQLKWGNQTEQLHWMLQR